MERLYRVGEVATLTRVSVRTLHHYDRIGLVRPSGYSDGGHRLYSQHDLLCLQQVLTLRYLGFSLRQIGELLRRPDFDLAASMRAQRGVLRERIAELQNIESLLGTLLARHAAAGSWDWELVAQASAAVQDSLTKGERMTPEEMQRQFEELDKEITPEGVRQIEQDWAALLAEVRANRNLDPASPKAQELAGRWEQLAHATFRGRRDLMEAVRQNYQAGKYQDIEAAPKPEDFELILKARAARPGEQR